MFSLNLVTKNMSLKGFVPVVSKCKIPGCYYSASKTYVRDRIFKLTPIQASVIYQIR